MRLSSLQEYLDSKKCVKIVCGAGNEDSAEIKKLCALYAAAGARFFDVNASLEAVRAAKEGINIAIIGKPNVGKSSILNKLLDEEKAIVTDVEGTTRDTVEGSITINGVSLNIIDTAGIRKTEDIVEKIGVEKSINLINEADLVILVLNYNEELTNDDRKILEYYTEEDRDRGYLKVYNRRGIIEEIPLVSISIGIVDVSNANKGIANLREYTDALIVIPNDKLFSSKQFKQITSLHKHLLRS